MATLISGSTGVNKITDGTITNADIASGAAIAGSKLVMPTGSVLQVVTATSTTETSTTSTSWVALSDLTLSITPSSTSSKIWIVFSVPQYVVNSGSHMTCNVFRGSVSGTTLGNTNWGFGSVHSGSAAILGNVSGNYLDSPNTTSSQTYTVAHKIVSGGTGYSTVNSGRGTITLMEIAG